MFRALHRLTSYVRYYLDSLSKHSVRSPSVFSFITRVLETEKQNPVFDSIESLKKNSFRNKTKINHQDFGTGGKPPLNPLLKTGGEHRRSRSLRVSKIARRTSVSPKYGKLLYRMVDFYKPSYALELGTSLGISAMYQASAMNEDGSFYTLEGSPELVELAKKNFSQLGLENVNIISGEFSETLPKQLEKIPTLDYAFFDGNHTEEATLEYFEICLTKANLKSVFIFDDIHWSEEMERAWEKIKKYPQITLTIDLFRFGLCFFFPNEYKKHYMLGF